MNRSGHRNTLMSIVLRVTCGCAAIASAAAASPPSVTAIFPAGLRAGSTVDWKLSGAAVETVKSLHSNIPSARFEKLGAGQFRVSIPAETSPGFYDLWALGPGGLSAPSSIQVGRRNEVQEPLKSGVDTPIVPLNTTVNGRISAAGEIDTFRFKASKGQRVFLECFAERLDSRLRAVLELIDANGRKLSASRGHVGRDPSIDWTAPSDGEWTLRLSDLTFGGGDDFVYRLDIDTGPRPAFAFPGSAMIGKPASIEIFGRNLPVSGQSKAGGEALKSMDRIESVIPPDRIRTDAGLPIRRKVAGAVVDGFAHDVPGGNSPVFVAAGELPVISAARNRSRSESLKIECPSDIEGMLENLTDQAWFSFEARRGEVFHFEAFGERIGSPVDLRIGIFNSAERSEIASFSDVPDSAESSLPVGHNDPVGRWVAPANGRYELAVQNLSGGSVVDPRRVYRLSVRREEPDFRVVATPVGTTPAGLNVPAGGRQAFELLALRRRGFNGPIRVFAEDLPSGVECPDIWIGPETNRALMVIAAGRDPVPQFEKLRLASEAEEVGRRPVLAASFVRTVSPVVEARLVSGLAFAIAGEAPVRIEADAHRSIQHHLYGTLPPVHMAGGVVDVAVRVDRRDPAFDAPVRLSFDGLPPQLVGRTAILPAGVSEGWISLYLPQTLKPGRYSFLVRAETNVPGKDPAKPEAVVVHSQPVSIETKPAAFLVEADPFAARKVKRGETFQVRYASRRRNGFIGKMHTEIAVAGIVTDVPGLRGRGETFVSQTDQGSLQIVVNADAPLGPVRDLRLLTVGVIEDEPVFQGAVFLDLEIVE